MTYKKHMKQFIKQHKYHLIVLILLLVIAGISGYQYWKMTNYQPASSADGFPITNEMQNVDVQKTDNSKQIPDNSYQITKQETTSSDLAEIKPEDLQLTNYELKANDYPISSSTTVYNLMQLASADSRQPFLFETEDYGSMGLFINSINGLKNNPQTGEYWIYYINSESAKIGISNQIVKSGDVIKWRYEKSNF